MFVRRLRDERRGFRMQLLQQGDGVDGGKGSGSDRRGKDVGRAIGLIGGGTHQRKIIRWLVHGKHNSPPKPTITLNGEHRHIHGATGQRSAVMIPRGCSEG